MRILGLEVSFKKDVPETKPLGDAAYSEDSIFQRNNMEKYNPDSLIGRRGHAVYRKMMMDEQVKAVVHFKRDAITSRDFIFECDVEELGEEESERRCRIAQSYFDFMNGTPIDAFNAILSAQWQGVSFTEKVYRQITVDGKTYWGLDSLKLKPFDSFVFQMDDFGNVLGLIQKVNGREIKLDIAKFIHHVQNPDYDEQYGQSELREAYRAWFSKDAAITFYNMWLERSASGFKWIQTNQSANTPGYNALKAVLSNTVNGAGMLLGKDDEFNIEFPSSDGGAFTRAVELHDLAIARSLLVPNLMGITPAGQTGSYSQSETQLEAFLWTLDQDTMRLEETLNEQLMRDLGEVNFGDDFYPRIKFKPVSEARKYRLIEVWGELLSKGGAERSDADENHIRELLEFPEKDTDTVSKPVVPPENEEQPNSPESTDDEEAGEQLNPKKVEEIRYSATVQVAAKRVDFKVMQRTTEVMEDDKQSSIGEVTKEITDQMVQDLKVSMSQGDADVSKIKADSKKKSKLQRRVNASLQDFWRVGIKHATTEVDKAKGLAFSMNINMDRVEFIASDFFKQKSFKVAGDMSGAIQSLIQNEIANGMKGGKTFAEIETAIYRAVGGAGYLTEEDYRQALGEAIDPELKNPAARINTMLRTNGFEAINEARYAYFTDPVLEGFVQALEYTSIMDTRTTQICQHLDGHVHAADSSVWSEHRPPNHYNCRSLLIPVTEIDEWTESEDPTIQPQKGFQ